jgi:hypothetical protein
MNFSQKLTTLALAISLCAPSVVLGADEVIPLGTAQKKEESYSSRWYNANRGLKYAQAGTATFVGHLWLETIDKHRDLVKDISVVKVASPILLATSALLFCLAALTPKPQYQPEDDVFANKREAQDHYFKTELWALAGLAAAGGTIALEYIMPYLSKTSVYDAVLKKAQSFFGKIS